MLQEFREWWLWPGNIRRGPLVIARLSASSGFPDADLYAYWSRIGRLSVALPLIPNCPGVHPVFQGTASQLNAAPFPIPEKSQSASPHAPCPNPAPDPQKKTPRAASTGRSKKFLKPQDCLAYEPLTAAATSAAKSSSFFSMPSPTSRRTKPRTSAPASAAAFSTVRSGFTTNA